MRTIVPPDDVSLLDIEDLTLQINRGFRDLDGQGIAPIIDGVDLNNLQHEIHAGAATAPHDTLTGVEASVKHLLFLLLDGTRPMTGSLSMAENNIDDIGGLNFDVVIGASTYDMDITAVEGLGSHPQMQHVYSKAGYTATGVFAPNYRSIDSVTQHIWMLGDGLYISNAGAGGTGSIYLADGQFVSLIAGGTAPFKMTSTTMCANLNADLLDGYEGAAFAALAENELITGDWTFGGSAKLYLNDASALGGTEYITSGADTYTDIYHGAGGGQRTYDENNLLLTIARWSAGVPTLTKLTAPVQFNIVVGATRCAYWDASFYYSYVQFKQESGSMVIHSDYLEPNDGALWFGAGYDAALGYDGVNLQILPARVGTGYVNIYKATDAASVAMLTLEGDRATMANDDEIYQSWKLSDDAGGQLEYGRISCVATDVTNPGGGGGTSAFTFDVHVAGVLSQVFEVSSDGAGFVGGMRLEQATISAATTLTSAHYIVLCDTDTAGAAFTVTLPAVASHTDRVYYIKNTGTGSFDVTVDGDGAETIDGAATQPVADGDCLAIVCDGTEWWVI